MTKRVYKYTGAQYGISSLEKKRLKLSTINDLNDPFDLVPIDTSHPAIAHAVAVISQHFWSEKAILCFSRNWDNLLLWSHYGNSHTGICLGFDISEGEVGENYDTDVLYQANLLQIRRIEDISFDLANRMLRTKHESWSYEQEVRLFVGLNDPPDENKLHWIEFGPQLVLKEVIIGAQCDPTWCEKVVEAVRPFGDRVECSWAGMRSDAFRLVKQKHAPQWQRL